ncbi:hypothetical protein [Acinetobacter proteolyticus]|uniref:Uncharacterized protein n=1 Tax=Acinetobacter proteolyticus TaxID=1776741 RepID=A0A2N0WIF1_9GAMM|nr:hypothetical protein [Acinetobacter proteolyticus]PKF35577.1 hypothetical protein CW311_04620 [Acinetobacter proteolyticus]
MNALKGTMLLHHGVFDGVGKLNTFPNTVDSGLYNKLPNLFLIIICEKVGSHKQLKAGFSIKTDLSQRDPAFPVMMKEMCEMKPELSQFPISNITFLVQSFSQDSHQLTEHEFILAMTQMYMRHHVDGTA